MLNYLEISNIFRILLIQLKTYSQVFTLPDAIGSKLS
nr:MAG TPA: hypothetical protein [Caudoviricetes sp.]